MYSLKVVSS